MTGELFREWLSWFAKHIGTDRQVRVLLDNFSGHEPGNIIFENIRMKLLPPHTTSTLRPCDEAIIGTLKAHTRRVILRHLLEFIEKYPPTLESGQYRPRKGELKIHKFAPESWYLT